MRGGSTDRWEIVGVGLTGEAFESFRAPVGAPVWLESTRRGGFTPRALELGRDLRAEDEARSLAPRAGPQRSQGSIPAPTRLVPSTNHEGMAVVLTLARTWWGPGRQAGKGPPFRVNRAVVLGGCARVAADG